MIQRVQGTLRLDGVCVTASAQDGRSVLLSLRERSLILEAVSPTSSRSKHIEPCIPHWTDDSSSR